MDEITELRLLKELESKVRSMFDFTGWSDGVDDDAAQAIINVDAILKDLTNWRLLQERYAHSAPEQLSSTDGDHNG